MCLRQEREETSPHPESSDWWEGFCTVDLPDWREWHVIEAPPHLSSAGSNAVRCTITRPALGG